MRAGGSQLKPALFVFILNVCFYSSFQLSDLQVRVEVSSLVKNGDVLLLLQFCDVLVRPVTAVGLYLLLMMSFVAHCPSRFRVISGMSAVRRDSSARLGGGYLLLIGRWSDRGTLLCEK